MMLCHPLECLYMPMMIPLGNESAKVTNKKKTRISVLAQGTQSCLRDGVRGRRANRNLLRPETLDPLEQSTLSLCLSVYEWPPRPKR